LSDNASLLDMPSSMVNESHSSASRGLSRQRKRRGPSMRRRLHERFPRYRVRRIIFFFFLGIATLGAARLIGSYQPAESTSPE
jgi:hypothetical protein